MTARVRLLRLLLLVFAPALVGYSVTVPTAVHVPADDSAIRYEGRFDVVDRAAPVVVWQASRIRLAFTGDSVALRFDDVRGQSFFDVVIDGHTQLLGLRESAPAETLAFSGLGAGRHELVLFKRSEASAGSARFRGVELAPGATAAEPTLPDYRLRMQFFGDSITAGACNEDGATDQWADRSSHNNARAYGALTATAFAADYRNIAVSGMGVATGWNEVKAGEMWDRIYPRADAPRADLRAWVPELLFINLGENDDSFTTAKQQPFPTEAYINNYVALVQSFRRAWPDAHIVLLRGGMFGGARSERLCQAWEKVVERAQAADPKVSHFIFQHWSSNHPRVDDHRAMAEELIGWLRAQPFMQPYTR